MEALVRSDQLVSGSPANSGVGSKRQPVEDPPSQSMPRNGRKYRRLGRLIRVNATALTEGWIIHCCTEYGVICRGHDDSIDAEVWISNSEMRYSVVNKYPKIFYSFHI
jgi:hypothetical protein